jgi:hypothetical protein
MSFVSYPHLILLISGQMLSYCSAGKFWNLNTYSLCFKKNVILISRSQIILTLIKFVKKY